MGFFYVYILQSESDPERFYVGFTEALKDRLARHNSGGVPHTAKFRPWKIKTAVASHAVPSDPPAPCPSSPPEAGIVLEFR